LVLIDDLVVGLAAAVTTASLIVLGIFLTRYRTLVKDATKSNDLAKNLWDAMNARLTTQDTRIVDLMARVEVYQVRNRNRPIPPAAPITAQKEVTRQVSRVELQPSQQISQPQTTPSQPGTATRDTLAVILRTLESGPKTPNQIRDVIGLTREHTGRLMKQLFTRGLVVRNDQNKPYVYEITEPGRRYLDNSSV
jgi:predicted transcriptional regulator